MTNLPPLMRDQRKVDAENLKLLAIFHFVLGGLAVLGLGFLFLHWTFMHAIFTNPAMKNPKGSLPPQEFFDIFKWFYFVMGGFMVTAGILNVVSGACILKRRARIFSIVVSGLNCFCIPFGTALGVFTIIVLIRDSIVEAYEVDNSRTAT